MNKDQIKGQARRIKGSLKKTAGRLTGNKSLEREGATDKATGNIRQGYGDFKQDVKDSS